MMEGFQVVSYLLTNELRIILGLFLVAKLMKIVLDEKAFGLAALGGVFITALSMAIPGDNFMIAAEIVILSVLSWCYLRGQLQLCVFYSFFYEVGTAFWEFLISAWLGVLFGSASFIRPGAWQHLLGIWLVRLAVIAGTALLLRRQDARKNKASAVTSVIAVLGLVGVVSLSQQAVLQLEEDWLTGWIIFALILLFAILLYRMKNQHEMEAEITRLKQEQAEILERDYQTLRRTYADNAKLYHDLHNHIETIYQSLKQGDMDTAAQYCEELRTPVREISQTVWTGDKALDYLISSKMGVAEQLKIRTRVNIEYPHNTNIRSVDVTTILGNLLDNALEAAEGASDNLRFLYLTIRRINDMLVIKVENGCSKAPISENGMLCTSKKDKEFHGWGIKSAAGAAKRYDGTLDTNYDNGVFRAVVTLCYQPIKRK